MKPIKASINCTKINKALMKDGKYLNVVIWPNKKGPDEWGNTHIIKQDVSKEQREQGIEGQIIGNAKFPSEQPSAPPPPRHSPTTKNDPDLDQPEEDIPFR